MLGTSAPVVIVSATRLGRDAFFDTAPLGVSLSRIEKDARIVVDIAFENERPLADAYNARTARRAADELLVFVHDDVWITDVFLPGRLDEALRSFDVVGVAGNRRRLPRQPAWAFSDLSFTWDDKEHLSGTLAHGNGPFGPVSFFGDVPAECELFDGVFLAARCGALGDAGAQFDPQFAFHMYDLDFCRAARSSGLTLGTWPISLTHRSGGAFGTPEWLQSYAAYIRKWGA